MPVEDDETLREILESNAETIAVVGCSRTPGKAAHDVPKYLQDNGYEVIPVNPNADEVLGRRTVDSLTDVEEEIDLVCVFRPSDEVSGIVDAALERDDADVIWTQKGIRDDDAAARAEAEGRTVVQDRCMMVEHRRLFA
ncbi:CoA-binding protein [Natrialbaceae archaeon GCM10025810]|uniref:CoA-binding protein n=1 Tax=Halovalidus salilacus TaxID=3075124 RepID=UPI003617C856